MEKIENILAAIPESISKRIVLKKELQQLFEQKKGKLVIYGHGNLGKQLQTSMEAAGWKIQFFIDAKQPTDLGEGVLSLDEADQYIALDSPIIVAIYDLYRAFSSIQDTLRARGFTNILKITDLRVWPELFIGGHIHSTLSWDIGSIQKGSVLKAYSLMADGLSRTTFSELLHFMVVDPDTKLTLCPEEDQYMPSDVYIPSPKERIIDCGAFDGDTMRAFSRAEDFESYLCVEPDPLNVARLERSIQKDLPEKLQERVKYINCAVSDEEGSISFTANGSSNSFVDESKQDHTDNIKIAVQRLENIGSGGVSLIKMDIEGFELRALRGAEKLILENKPILAICGYHQQSDLWEIPLYMKKLLPEHYIFLRNYVGVVEYVFYAVPPRRIKKPNE